jgi:hypothetical protein
VASEDERAMLAQTSNVDEAFEGFGKSDAKTWTDKEKRKVCKAFSSIQLHLSNHILQESVVRENCRGDVVELGIVLHVQRSNQ